MPLIKAKCYKCGELINITSENDASLCPNCNEPIANDKAIRCYKFNLEQRYKEINSPPKEKNGKGCFVAFIIVSIIVAIILMVPLVPVEEHHLKLNENSSSLKIELTTNYKIKDLKITIKFYNKNNQLLITKTMVIGDIQKGESYTIKFTAAELISLALSEKYAVEITSGRIAIGNLILNS